MKRRIFSKPKHSASWADKFVRYLRALFSFFFSKVGVGSILGISFVFLVFYAISCQFFEKTDYFLHQQISQLSQKLGFSLKEVLVFGRYRAAQEEILQNLSVKEGQSIFDCDLEAMQNHLQKLAWVKNAAIRRSLWGGLYIYLTEREPIAIYHDPVKEEFYLVDKEGTLIHQAIAPCFRGLPTLSGEGAPKKAQKMLEKLNPFKPIRKKLTAMAFIKKRRWNLKINNIVEVKLPEAGVEKALQILNRLIEQGKATSGDIVLIDLRIEGKAILKLSESGKEFLKNYRSGKKV